MSEPVQVLQECERCHYVACLCALRRAHKPACIRRRAILAKPVVFCEKHRRAACFECWPCDCKEENFGF